MYHTKSKITSDNRSWDEQLKDIRDGNHRQFFYDKKKEVVMCKCGEQAAKFRDGYLCSSITVVSNCPY